MSNNKEFKLSKNDAEPLVIQTKDFTWANPFTYGSCKLSGALDGTLNKGPTIRIRSDGTGEVIATFYSDSSGDAWIIKDLHLIDSGGVALSIILHLSSPATVTDRQEIFWSGPFTYDPNFFFAITTCNFEYHC
jgi:hypothetical protein